MIHYIIAKYRKCLGKYNQRLKYLQCFLLKFLRWLKKKKSHGNVISVILERLTQIHMKNGLRLLELIISVSI